MAGHVQDRWYKTEPGPNGKEIRVKTDRYGSGMRYRARYIGPDGAEKNKSFPNGQKRKAEDWLTNIEADMSRGQYMDPQAGRITFKEYTEKWLSAQTTDLNTRSKVKSQVQRHAIPLLGSRPMSAFRPSHIREWLSELEAALPALGLPPRHLQQRLRDLRSRRGRQADLLPTLAGLARSPSPRRRRDGFSPGQPRAFLRCVPGCRGGFRRWLT